MIQVNKDVFDNFVSNNKLKCKNDFMDTIYLDEHGAVRARQAHGTFDQIYLIEDNETNQNLETLLLVSDIFYQKTKYGTPTTG